MLVCDDDAVLLRLLTGYLTQQMGMEVRIARNGEEVLAVLQNWNPDLIILDEFQRFVTPTIADNLDEARGFGLHLTLAHQFPNQLLNAGPNGKRVYDSIMENASSKVVFRLSHEDNLKPLALWLFRGVMDPEQVKHELYSTKVMAYREEDRISTSRTTSP